MSRTITFLLALLIACSTATAQPMHEKNRDKVRSLKIAYITEQLDLQPEQAEKFWPVYNKFENEMWQIRKGFIDQYKNDHPNGDRNTAQQYIEDNLDYQEQQLALKKKYKDQLLKIISPEQLAKLYKAERGFKQMLIKELGKRQGPPPGRRPVR